MIHLLIIIIGMDVNIQPYQSADKCANVANELSIKFRKDKLEASVFCLPKKVIK